ncbi:benzoate 1,2-dioxygenase large subunit [Gordonia amicalis NBRC 100051 = JCM 11271]|nr:benzoate 1,2-dioxygenase large subunit [Gordonia amicalis NBRC 100051 = JCM 11271]
MTASVTEHLHHVNSVLGDAVVDDREAGIYRANRRIFTDEDIFELEMKHIFEATGSTSPTRARWRTPVTTSPPTSDGSRS